VSGWKAGDGSGECMESKGWLRRVDRKKPSVHGGNFSVNRWRSKGRFKGQIGDSVWNTFPSISRPLLYSLNRSITIRWWNVLIFFPFGTAPTDSQLNRKRFCLPNGPLICLFGLMLKRLVIQPRFLIC
jgi:hypothetical protein